MNNLDNTINTMTYGTSGHDSPAAIRIRGIAEDACLLLGDGYSVVAVYQRGNAVHVTLTDGYMARWFAVRLPLSRTYTDAALSQRIANAFQLVASGLPMPKGER